MWIFTIFLSLFLGTNPALDAAKNKAAGGVIVVNTKTGAPDTGVRINYDFQYGTTAED